MNAWIEYFASATTNAARLATEYLRAAAELSASWHARLAASPNAPRAGAAAWAVIAVLPAHPMITAAVASAATNRAKAAIYQAIAQLETAGILIPVSDARRNQMWEVDGMLELIEGLESGERPTQR